MFKSDWNRLLSYFKYNLNKLKIIIGKKSQELKKWIEWRDNSVLFICKYKHYMSISFEQKMWHAALWQVWVNKVKDSS